MTDSDQKHCVRGRSEPDDFDIRYPTRCSDVDGGGECRHCPCCCDCPTCRYAQDAAE